MGACIAFCLLTSVVAFFISTMMSGESIATFVIPAVEHHWDLEQKAKACRNAGFMYLFLAIALTAKSFFASPQTREERVSTYDKFFSAKEASPLLPGDAEAACRGGIAIKRGAGGDYGSVEMKSVREDSD